ncbi:MAG: DUF72 domain-containing protein [Chloroflexi bacterium]|nr:DUF72 domain-containing protein [Chloroflexota bacterium]
MARCFIGTSGWSYDSWVGQLYPEDLERRRWLEHYAQRFSSVEINATFYRTPPETMFRAWAGRTPDGFTFAVKASRYITHIRRLDVEQASVDKVMQRARLLGERLGPVLYQLPPRWRCDPARLERCARLLPSNVVNAFEFRDASWFDERVYEVLRRHGLVFCIYHMPEQESPLVVTGPAVYLRFHGTSGLYYGTYGPALKPWGQRIRGWLKEGLDVYAYFNNTGAGEAVDDALYLKELVGT